MNLTKLVRPNILALKPYSSARDEYDGTNEILLDANENPYPSKTNRYPDPYQRELKKSISALKGVGINEIFLGNGSDEAIDLLFRIFCEPGKDEIIITDPTYGMYQVSAGIQNIKVNRAPLTEKFELKADQILEQQNSNTKLLFICSPNNPSGNSFDEAEIDKVLEGFQGIVVIDEAYVDFSGQASFSAKINKYNLVVLQTFSKAWGMAGIRLGMAFAREEIIHLFNKVKAPYNLSILAQEAALAALHNRNDVRNKVSEIIAQRKELEKQLNQLPLVDFVYPSDTNFLLVRFKDAQQVYTYLVDHKIIVRDRSSVLHGENCLRLTVGTPEENTELVNTLTKMRS